MSHITQAKSTHGIARLVLFVIAFISPFAAKAATVSVDTSGELQSALVGAQPGDTIEVAPGSYPLSNTTQVGVRNAYFYSTANGTASDPITLKSQDSSDPAILKGGDISDGGYTLYLTGAYWRVESINVTHGQKGVVLDNANHVVLDGVQVYHVGQEGIHVRDGSSNVVIENSYVNDTGATLDSTDMGFAEGIYIGSDRSVWEVNEGESGSNVGAGYGYDRKTNNTIVRNNITGSLVRAEPMDIKEGASGTLVEDNVFLGGGIVGDSYNYADSFIDVKAYNTTIRNNVGYRQNNGNIDRDIHEIDRTSTSPWCPAGETSNKSLSDTSDGNTYSNNVFYEGDPPEGFEPDPENPGSGGDDQAPSTPTGLSATAASSDQVDMNWSASSDNVGVAEYEVYRDGALVGTTTTTSFSDTGLSASTSYSYAVAAKDAAGNVSSTSDSAGATTLSGGQTPTGSLTVHYEEGDGADETDNDIRPYFLIVNEGSSSVPLSELTIRYYYKKEASVPQEATIDYAVVGKSNVTASVGSLGSPTATADTFLEVGFTAGAGSVPANDDSGKVKARLNNGDWSDYIESNDYSYDAGYSSFAEYDKVGLYQNGVLIWGQEP